MKRPLKITFAIVICIAIGFFGFILGGKKSLSHFSSELNATQAMLAFNHYKRYKEIETCLLADKPEAAKIKASISSRNEKQLISEFLNNNDHQRTIDYINLRHEDGVESFKSYSNPVQSWSEPTC